MIKIRAKSKVNNKTILSFEIDKDGRVKLQNMITKLNEIRYNSADDQKLKSSNYFRYLTETMDFLTEIMINIDLNIKTDN